MFGKMDTPGAASPALVTAKCCKRSRLLSSTLYIVIVLYNKNAEQTAKRRTNSRIRTLVCGVRTKQSIYPEEGSCRSKNQLDLVTLTLVVTVTAGLYAHSSKPTVHHKASQSVCLWCRKHSQTGVFSLWRNNSVNRSSFRSVGYLFHARHGDTATQKALSPIRRRLRWCTLTPPGEHHWTDRVRRRCGLLSNYFDHLFRFLDDAIGWFVL